MKFYFLGLVSGILLVVLLPFCLGEVDFQRVQNAEKPIFSSVSAAASDGGSLFYKGFGYELYSWHSDTGLACVIGPEISYYYPLGFIKGRRETREFPVTQC